MNAPITLHAEFLKWPETLKLLDAFNAANIDARFVGGSVRDALLGLPVKDVDLCTPATPDKVTEALQKASIRALPTGIDHGTVTALIDAHHFEITTLRRDTACDGRHAVVEYTTDYAEDARRRDFTVNALSADPSGKIYDYHNGLDDLKTKQLRFIGNASDRIIEDALRILRLFRFQAQLGFSVDKTALDACAKLKEKLSIISAERIKSEIFKLLGTPLPAEALQNMAECGVWAQLFNPPPPLRGEGIESLLAAETALNLPANALVRFAFLVSEANPENAKSACAALQEKLKLSNDETRSLTLWLTHLQEIRPILTLAEQRKLQRSVNTCHYLTLLLLASARENNAHASAYQQMIKDAMAWHIPEFPVSGGDLIQLGFTQGATLGSTLKTLEQQWEDSGYRLTKAELLAQAKA